MPLKSKLDFNYDYPLSTSVTFVVQFTTKIFLINYYLATDYFRIIIEEEIFILNLVHLFGRLLIRSLPCHSTKRPRTDILIPMHRPGNATAGWNNPIVYRVKETNRSISQPQDSTFMNNTSPGKQQRKTKISTQAVAISLGA